MDLRNLNWIGLRNNGKKELWVLSTSYSWKACFLVRQSKWFLLKRLLFKVHLFFYSFSTRKTFYESANKYWEDDSSNCFENISEGTKNSVLLRKNLLRSGLWSCTFWKSPILFQHFTFKSKEDYESHSFLISLLFAKLTVTFLLFMKYLILIKFFDF